MGFIFEKQNIDDVILIKSDKFDDERGFLKETYKKSVFIKNKIECDFVQDNISFSKKRALRGLHFQNPPYTQAKLVKCVKGSIIDIALDIRKNSKTFGKYCKVKLKENDAIFIPEGFAHGFVALEDTIVYYKMSKEYNKNSQNGVLWCDSELDIDWGIDFEPILSQKDKKQPLFKELNL